MATIPAEPYQPSRSQNYPLQRLAATRDEVILLSHLLQASLVVERRNPVREAITTHWNLVRNVMIILVIVLSITIGLLAPYISHTLGM